MVTLAMATPLSLSIASTRYKLSSAPLFPYRNLTLRSVVSVFSSSYCDSSVIGFSSRRSGFAVKLDHNDFCSYPSNGVIEAENANPPITPAEMTLDECSDLSTVLLRRNRIIFISEPIDSDVAETVISQLVDLARIDEKSDILMYLNCPGGSIYSVLAIYDCMSWIKPRVGTVCFGLTASQGTLLLAGGEKGMRYAMANARIMIHQPESGCEGHAEDLKRKVDEEVQLRHKIDKMYAAFTGQPLEKVQQYTQTDTSLSVSEAMEFGLIDGVLDEFWKHNTKLEGSQT